ncbi:hypothetical protein OC861_005502, partial [Tilletia horrida]
MAGERDSAMGKWSAHIAQVIPARLCAFLVEFITAKGVKTQLNTRVTGVDVDNTGHVAAVKIQKGEEASK